MAKWVLFFLSLWVAGCASVPSTNVHQPMSARPTQRYEPIMANGAIYQTGTTRPLFEDRRARYVGDTITIKITENTRATKASNNKLDRSSSNDVSVSSMAGLPGKGALGMALNTSTANAFSGKGEAAANNVFNGNLTTTVIEVLPNGYLLVSGEKQLSIGGEQEFIRLSGVINPSFVDTTNSIDSSRVADARIEYKSAGQLSEGMTMGWLGRFFMNVLPF